MADFLSSLQKSSLTQRFQSGVSWSFSGKIISAAAALATNALLARLLSPEEMGTYFLAFSLVAVLAISGQWGMNRGLVKLIASELANGHSALARNGIIASFIVVASISLFIVLFLISPAGGWTLTAISGSNLLVSISLFMGLWLLIKAMQGLVSESFRGFHDIRLATLFGGLMTAVLSMLFFLAFWLFYGHATLEQVVTLTVLAAGISLLTGLVFIFHKLQTLDRGGNIAISRILRFGFPLFLTSMTLFGVKEFHIWVLAMFQPESEVALYGSAVRLVILLEMPLIIVNSVIPPIIAELYSQGKYQQVQRVLQKTATLVSIPAFFVFCLILLFGGEVLGVTYGASYKEAYIPFVILAVGQFVNVLTGSPGILLTMSGHEGVVMKSALGSGIIGVASSFILVPEFGAIGAAVGYSVGVMLVNVTMWTYSHRRLAIFTHGSPMVIKEILLNR